MSSIEAIKSNDDEPDPRRKHTVPQEGTVAHDRAELAYAAGEICVRAADPAEYPRTYPEQRLARQILAWRAGRLALNRGGSTAITPEVLSEERRAIEVELDSHKTALGQWLIQTLADSPYHHRVRLVVGRSKALESTIDKLERRQPNGSRISDLVAFRIILSNEDSPGIGDPKDQGPAMDVLHFVRERLSVPEFDEDGQRTVAVTRTPWSHEQFYCRQGKYVARVGNEVVPFEVQAYHEDEYEHVCKGTQEYYLQARPKAADR